MGRYQGRTPSIFNLKILLLVFLFFCFLFFFHVNCAPHIVNDDSKKKNCVPGLSQPLQIDHTRWDLIVRLPEPNINIHWSDIASTVYDSVLASLSIFSYKYSEHY